MKFAPLAAVIAMALSTSACVIIDADDHQNVSMNMTKSDLEPIYGATIDKDALVVRVSSGVGSSLMSLTVRDTKLSVRLLARSNALPASLAQAGRAGARQAGKRPMRRTGVGPARGAAGTSLVSPMQGTIVKVAVDEGATVAEGDLVVVLEAMKMEQPLTAHRAGVVRSLAAAVGTGVSSGTVICEILDAE